jgi:pSer/pThr/pTyr-binding forkhead associated (FHA) protein
MIWVEILSRHRDIASRFRFPGPEVSIGRGYDNDVIVDDPYVAARHLRVFRDGDGRLVAEDLGSTNGTFLDGGKSRLPRILLDGRQPIRIGQTFLRVREPGHVVEPERVAPVRSNVLAVVVAMALGAAVLGLEALSVWFAQTGELRALSYLTPLLSACVVILTWVGIWALLSRIFAGRAHFLRNLLIALSGAFAVSFYGELAKYLAFAWTWPVASTYEYVVIWIALAIVCFFHLREVGHTRLGLKGAVVAILLVVAISVQTLQRSQALSDSGRQTTLHVLMPPSLRAVPYRSEADFFGSVEDLKTTLDRDRAQTGSRPGLIP